MGLFDFFKKKDTLSDNLRPRLCPSEISVDIVKQVDAVTWANFSTAYGNAEQTVPQYLKNLFCTDTKIALEATHQLWCSLCHQHAYISEAALPSYDIIRKGLFELNDDLKAEILDIIKGFSYCTTKEYSMQNLYPKQELYPWEKQLRDKLEADVAFFKELTHHEDADIANLATEICGFLEEA